MINQNEINIISNKDILKILTNLKEDKLVKNIGCTIYSKKEFNVVKKLNIFTYFQMPVNITDTYLYNECVKLKKSDCSTHPHNMFLEIIHDGGIILLVLFYYFFILMIMNNIKSKQKNYYDLSIIAILLTFINPIQITGSIFSTWHASIIFFIFGLTLISKKNEH